jgi:hypothetical protein
MKSAASWMQAQPTAHTDSAATMALAEPHSPDWHAARLRLGGSPTCDCGYRPGHVSNQGCGGATVHPERVGRSWAGDDLRGAVGGSAE